MDGIVQTINVVATLKAMEVGSHIFLDSDVNENTLRNACVRLKRVVGGQWSVDKRKNPCGFIVTRIA